MSSEKCRPFCLGLNVLNSSFHTVLSSYNLVNLLQNTHNRRTISRPFVWNIDVIYEFIVPFMFYPIHCTALWKSFCIEPCYNKIRKFFVIYEYFQFALDHIDGLVQDYSNSSALAVELL